LARGISSQSGPAPDPNALRRDRGSDNGWVTLPAGRKGKAPAWPLSEQTDREVTFWQREWRRPQAVMWERYGQVEEVALYVRALGEAEKLGASVASRALVRQLQEALGISLPGLARNRGRIPAPAARNETAKRPATRSGLRVVSGGPG